ncbi:MAG: CHAT domain-containing protein [Pegethrix bostrychoides GSE-TBD4-15B]|uniref:CHAT domain-containing protein n=1 Tax=Pegethrix bostrychoides GSE-TBD4-15B TaxID=2839662 RepID=A0A951PDE0_9CYAN|nr:CHAT domain-containing protein [Pegethrix bostrychoides GSE-TBD4-15B]
MKLKSWRYILIALLAVGFCLLQLAAHPAKAQRDPAQILYESGNFEAAIELLQREIQQGDPSQQAAAWANLAAIYQQLGRWPAANQAISTSLMLAADLPAANLPAANLSVRAQVLDVQAQLQLVQGQAEAALVSWQQSATLYQQQGNLSGMQQSQFNQAQALEALGLYRRAVTLLRELNDQLQPDQPLDQPLKVNVLRSLGEALQVAGDLSQSRQMLELALKLSADPASTAATQLSLGNLTQLEASRALSLSNLTPDEALQVLAAPPPATLAAAALQQHQVAAANQFVQQMNLALSLYRQAAQQAPVAAQSQLNQINLLIILQRDTEATALANALAPQLAALLPNHRSLSQQIKLALAEIQLKTGSPAARLTGVAHQAAALNDWRNQSFALGSLGQFYEQQAAIQVTQQALILAQSIQAADLAYRWQWQLGRLLKQQGDRAGAIAAYSEAVQSLQSLRSDLVAINREVQFSIQSQVEPVYRELADLLLDGDSPPSQAQLDQARQVIEGLQVAELDNFFREACLETELEIDQVIDRAQLSAAVFYTIVLPDRLEVILKLPQQELQHYSSVVDRPTLETTIDELLNELKLPYISQRSRALSQQVYRWLLAPATEALAPKPPISTLVFVLDGSLRRLPLSALFDGQQFLIEKYSVAVAPGLRLADPKPLRYDNLLIAGLSEARDNFAPLSFVAQEIQQIEAEIPAKVLFNQSFTQANFQKQVSQSDYAIVHIATHGQFSSNAADTFILAWDRPINVSELDQLLRGEATSPQRIELLVLSACQTAVGDRRAALGMAGMAIRAGASSTIASLWNLQDDSGAALMEQFYQVLSQNQVSKAEALRQAQLAILRDPQYGAPRFWASYLLLGSWL